MQRLRRPYLKVHNSEDSSLDDETRNKLTKQQFLSNCANLAVPRRAVNYFVFLDHGGYVENAPRQEVRAALPCFRRLLFSLDLRGHYCLKS